MDIILGPSTLPFIGLFLLTPLEYSGHFVADPWGKGEKILFRTPTDWLFFFLLSWCSNTILTDFLLLQFYTSAHMWKIKQTSAWQDLECSLFYQFHTCLTFFSHSQQHWHWTNKYQPFTFLHIVSFSPEWSDQGPQLSITNRAK